MKFNHTETKMTMKLKNEIIIGERTSLSFERRGKELRLTQAFPRQWKDAFRFIYIYIYI